jgi:hypothetical protein
LNITTQPRKNVAVYLAVLVAGIYFLSAFALPSAAYSAGPSTVRMPKVILRPFNTVAGNSVKVTGLGFTDSSTATVTFNGNTVASGVAINSTGGFVTNFVVPASTPSGSYTVKATDADGKSGSNTLTVTGVSAKITDSTDGADRIVGTTVFVTGTGFLSNAQITVMFGSQTVNTTTSNGSGGFSASFKVPELPGQMYYINATDGTNSAHVPFVINPHLTSSSLTVKPGQTITVNGTGFGPSDTVSFTYDGSSLSTSTSTGANGAFSVQITIPSTAPKGGHSLTASDTSGHAASILIRVTT